MKKFAMMLFATILVISLTSAIKPIDAERNLEYIVHIQVEVRNAQEQLISITESKFDKYIRDEIPDYVFDSVVGQKEIIVIDGINYEKVQFEVSYERSVKTDPDLVHDYENKLRFSLCGTSEYDKLSCMSLESAKYWILTEEGDVVTSKWTVLRVID